MPESGPVMISFEKLYGMMEQEAQRKFIEILIQEIRICEKCKPNGQWLKFITFKLPKSKSGVFGALVWMEDETRFHIALPVRIQTLYK